jgi:cell division protein FtsA
MLAMPVRVGTPQGISGLIDDINNPAFATSVGLLRFAQNDSHEDISSHNQSPSLPNLSKFPLKGILGKTTQFIKSLLP